ncbi:MAG TPA: sugar ABC transporter ATP-binding protein [Steroidobacteraceae bacterium]|jgi:ABC-type sugar transport system ATPase subunit|nr:sugar ABC transporter ATP-binding protein [Steroidobacteraceae bacterium]
MNAEIRPAIEARAIVKAFAGVRVLRGVNLQVLRGEIHALLGQNGAGKSTLVKVFNGVHASGTFEGEILLDGAPVRFASPADARRQGVCYVPQEIEVLPALSVAENIFAGHTAPGGGLLVDRRTLRDRATQLLAELGLAIDPRALVGGLDSACRHLIMIARAISARPRVIMLDEPTASLPSAEVERLLGVLMRLRSAGASIVYISHRLPEIMSLCDRATILKDGAVQAIVERADFSQERFIRAMSGRTIQRVYPCPAPPRDAHPVLEARNLSVKSAFGAHRGIERVDLDVRPGEIVGLTGMLGSGRTEILSALYGVIPHTGVIRIAGRKVKIRTPADARAAGIALLTEDRKHTGLLFNLSIRANVTIGALSSLSRWGVVQKRAESAAVGGALAGLGLKAHSLRQTPVTLSGGNQQKLLMARVRLRAPRILLLDEPTKGVDATTRHEIYRHMLEWAANGAALIVVASELDEIIAIAHRCVVVADGRIVDSFIRGEGGEDRVLRSSARALAAAGCVA